jgi:predicted nucleic acid-binding protein
VTASANERYVLDTSALLAMIEAEPGAPRVRELLQTSEILMPFVVGFEVYHTARQRLSEAEADYRLAAVRRLRVRWMHQVTENVLVTAGRFKAEHQVSFADALIAAFAAEADAILVHKDPEYDALASDIRQERLPYKPRAAR